MAKYLVTGGAGFIGSNIVNELLSRFEKVRVLDNFSTGKRSNVIKFMDNPNFELIEGDVRSFHIVRDAVKGCDFVLHQAALPSVQRSIVDPLTTNEVNVLGTLNILEASREFGVKRVVFASSSSIYGNTETLPKIESMAISPLSPYAISKYSAERYCQIYYEIYKVETVCLRYFNVFGENQDPQSQYSAVIPKFIKYFLENKQPEIYGDGTQSRDFTFVKNVVEANLLACKSSKAAGHVLNIASGKAYSLNEMVDYINNKLNKNIKPIFKENRKGDVKHSLADISKAKDLLSYTPIWEFKIGLEKVIERFINVFETLHI